MSKKVFLFIGLFWLAIFAVFIASKESVLRGGQEVLLQTVPVDPRDIFRGDYVTLRYEISTLDQADVVIFNRGWNKSRTARFRYFHSRDSQEHVWVCNKC